MSNIPIRLAREFLASGLSVLPAVTADKHPALASWGAYQKRLPTEKEIEAWFANAHEALCIVAGAVSGNLECLDFDAGGECFEPWTEAIPADLFGRLVVERTPSGGCHVVYRCEEPVDGNLKLAEGERNKKRATLIETRGEGGLFLCSPSPGYHLIQGAFGSVPTISAEERRVLLDAARALSEISVTAPSASPPHPDAEPSSTFDERPGDAFNRDGAAFCGLLEKHGWKFLGKNGDNEQWRRPGKDSGSLSATFNGVNFHVFSSNADPFPPGFNGSPFTVYALLEHGGDATAAAKDLLAQGYGKAADPCAGVDLTGILKQVKAPRGAKPEPKTDDPGPIPDSLLRVPGFIDELSAYSMRTAHLPNHVLSFAGALTLLAALAGRKVKDPGGTRPNLYVLALADSGSGKEQPRRVNKKIAAQLGFSDMIGDSIGSGQGLEDALVQRPSMLYQVDEIDTLFNKIKLKDAWSETLQGILLSIFGSSDSFLVRRSLAVQRGRGAPAGGDAAVKQPNLVLLGTGIPHLFYDSLTKRSLENGLLARCLVLEAQDAAEPVEPLDEDIPGAILDFAGAALREGMEFNLAAVNPTPRTVPFSDEAAAAALNYTRSTHRLKCELSAKGETGAAAIWARASEKAHKLALLYALSEGFDKPVITAEHYRLSIALVDHLTRRILFRAETSVHETDYEEQAQRVLRLLRARGGRLSHSALLKASHLDRDTFKRVAGTLVESGEMERTSELTGQRSSVVYALPEP